MSKNSYNIVQNVQVYNCDYYVHECGMREIHMHIKFSSIL